MPSDKAKVIDDILISAVRVFARAGFVGASLRDIATDADVPHSTINHYYGSKTGLFRAAIRWAWDEVDEERSKLLAAAMERHPTEPVPLEDLLYSLAYPVVRRALAGTELEVAEIAILTQHMSDATRFSDMLDRVDHSIAKWITAMEQTCPTLSREDVIWVFSFCVGVCYSWQVTSHRYDSLLGPTGKRSVEDVTKDIVSFGVAGIQSIVRMRTSS